MIARGDERWQDRLGSQSQARAASPLHSELLHALPELVFTCQPDGACDFVNQRWIEYTGVALEAQRGDGWLQQVHAEDRAAVRSAWEVALHAQRDFRCELRLLRCDHSARRFDARVVAVRDARGELQQWLGQCIDVQESWDLKERLREQTERIEKLVAAVPAVICTYEVRPDGSARFPYVSAKTRDVYGLEPEQMMQNASCLFERIHVDDAGPLGRGIQASADSMSTWHGEFRYAHPSKGERNMEGFSAPVQQADGAIVWHGIVFDVTQQHDEQLALQAAMQERLRAEQALHSSDQRLQSVVANMSEGLIIADAAGLLTHWNPAALEQHGMSREEDWKKRMPEFVSTFELSTLEGEVLPLEEWPMSRILRGEQLRGYVLRARRLDCDWQRVLGYGGLTIEQPDGSALSFLTITDLTERTRATEALQRMNVELERRVVERTRQLQHSNRELESFSYSVSHDLRAPLRAMNGYAQMLLEDYARELPEDAHRLLNVIADSGRRMGQLIDDLLALSRLGRKELNVTRVDMRALVAEVLADMHGSETERAHVSLGELPDCMGDAGVLKHVWVNLLSNAFKYAKRRSRIEVEVRGARTDAEVIYSVQDNGAGFDMRYVHKLFGVFQRLHTEDEFEGTGVGLAIVHRIVTRHGGRVWASAELDRGAVFSFSLPGAQAHD